MPEPFINATTFKDLPNITEKTVLKIAKAMSDMHHHFHRAIKTRQDTKIVLVLTCKGGQVTFAKTEVSTTHGGERT